MQYHALACDFDGTLAWDGQVHPSTVDALIRVRTSGRKLVLVTGRTMKDLADHLPNLDIFDRLVVENGAVIHDPASGTSTILGERPSDDFVADLRARGVSSVALGEVIVATWHPHEAAVLETIEMHGLEHQIIFNKGAVMVLPPGINKATGLSAALHSLQISLHNTVCIGDAENDSAMFRACELSVAVANALVTVKRHADLVTTLDHGAGVIELAERLIATDLIGVKPKSHRHDALLGWQDDGAPVYLHPRNLNVLLAGTPASGKSMFAGGLLGRLLKQQYQVLVIDPEGDYERIPGTIHLGHALNPPSVFETMQALSDPTQSVTVSLLSTSMERRKSFFEALYPQVEALQARFGHPHRLIIDEAHHLLSTTADPTTLLTAGINSVLFATVDPARLPLALLNSIDLVLGFGDAANCALRTVSHLTGQDIDLAQSTTPEIGSAIAWYPAYGKETIQLRCAPCLTEHRRHRRKYAEGDMGPERSFYFRGPDGQLSIRAQNLTTFLDIADRINDEVWLYHLERHDYSSWFAGSVGAMDLASEVVEIEANPDLNALQSRALIRSAIERKFAPPA